MKLFARYFLPILVLALGTALLATDPGASSEHFVVTNNIDASGANTGTVFKLSGTRTNPSLQKTGTLDTNVTMVSGVSSPNIQFIVHGPDVCLFLADPQNSGNEISAFQYPALTLTGNYNDPSITNSGIGMAFSARGNFLFVAYGDNTSFTGNLDVWRIRSGCALQILSTYSTQYPVGGLAASPDGKTLVVSYLTENGLLNGADSFSISSSGELTEHGPYGVDNANGVDGPDVTADSKYALFSVTGFYPESLTAVGIFAINSDGSLGNQYSYGGGGSLGPSIGTGSIRLSPDEKFIFVNDNSGADITTLNFSESPVSVTWSGCLTTVRVPKGEPIVYGAQITTALPSGAGGDLYLAEDFDFASIAVLQIDPTTGCTTEVPQSPFLTGSLNLDSVAPWPSRPF